MNIWNCQCKSAENGLHICVCFAQTISCTSVQNFNNGDTVMKNQKKQNEDMNRKEYPYDFNENNRNQNQNQNKNQNRNQNKNSDENKQDSNKQCK